VALVLYPLANGLSRILWGSVSDYFGRERTMFIAFLLQAIFLVALTTLGRQGDVLWVALVRSCSSPGASCNVLFPACSPNVWQQEFGGQLCFLYSAKGFASIVGGGLAAFCFEKTGTWDYAFYAALLSLSSGLHGAVCAPDALPKRARVALKPPRIAGGVSLILVFLRGRCMNETSDGRRRPSLARLRFFCRWWAAVRGQRRVGADL